MEQAANDEKSRFAAGFFCSSYVGLRAILVLMVMQGHYWSETVSTAKLRPLSFAVPIFFVLSGFLITHTLLGYEAKAIKSPWKRFYWRRALRILPPFYLVLFLAHLARGVPYLSWQLCYLINVKVYILSAFQRGHFTTFLHYGDFNAIHFWSVNVEEQFYILYPFFIAITAGRKRILWFAGLLLSFALLRTYLYLNQHHAFYGGLPFVAGEYILWGCLFAYLDFNHKALFLRSKWALYSSLAALCVLTYHDTSYGPFAQWKPSHTQTLYCIFIASFILALRYNGKTVVGRVLSSKLLAPLGQISYGAYLIHVFLNPVVDRVVEIYPYLAPFPSCPRAIMGPILTILAAGLMWVCFERPIDRFRKRLGTNS